MGEIDFFCIFAPTYLFSDNAYAKTIFSHGNSPDLLDAAHGAAADQTGGARRPREHPAARASCAAPATGGLDAHGVLCLLPLRHEHVHQQGVGQRRREGVAL